jgi:predicted nucleotidyltransferase
MHMYGLTTKQIDQIQAVFKKHSIIDKVVLYGSRAKGNYRDGSDIDLTLFGHAINISTLHALENELDDLLLPYSIDLSVFDKIENEDLIQHIDRIGVVFYEKK